MKPLIAALSGLLLVHPQAPNLAGTWTLDKGKSNGTGPNIVEQTLVVRAEAGRFTLENRYTTPQGPVLLTDTLDTDAVPRDFILKRLNGQEGPGRRSAKWLPDVHALEVSDSVVLDGPAGPFSRLTVQRWTIDPATGRLFQDVTVRLPPFTTVSVHNEFIRKP